MTTRILSILLFLSIATVGQPQPITNSGWFDVSSFVRTPPTTPPDGQAKYAAAAAKAFSGESFELLGSIHEPSAPIAEAITSDIQELARGLENDPLRIYHFVYNNIRYVHYFGSKKGAQLTLMERSGNDFDQCALLVALLRAAGHTDVSYQFAWTWFPYDIPDGSGRDLHHWLRLNLDNTNWQVTSNYLVDLTYRRGFPSGSAPGNNVFGFQHVWVTLTINGTTYHLDPSVKVSYYSVGLDIPTVMGFNSNALWSVAAGAEISSYVTNLNEASLRGTLTTYTTNLLNYVQNNYPNSEVRDLLGGWTIVPSTNATLPTALLYTIDEDIMPVQTWINQPTNMMSKLTVSFAGTNNTWMVPQLAGERITLTFATNALAQLWQEDTLIKQAFTTDPNNVTQVELGIDHPIGYWDWNLNEFVDTGDLDHISGAVCYQRTNASTYVIQYAFEPHWDWLQSRQKRLSTYRQQGLSPTSREIISETLNVIGLSWMIQCAAVEDIFASQLFILPANFHRIGRTGQENGRGYFTDVYMILSAQQPATGLDSASTQRRRIFHSAKNYFHSALEHGVIEQSQPGNALAASTVKMLQIANTNKQAVYLGHWSNWQTGSLVRSKLLNYDAGTLSTLDFLINVGYILLLPQNGSNHVATGASTWAGYGYVVTDAETIGMLISGNYYGGHSGTTGGPDPVYIDLSSQAQPDAFGSSGQGTLWYTDADPVSVKDATFLVDSTDLVVGQSVPRGLQFARHYNGTRRSSNLAGMAPGWIHNYYGNAIEVSAPEAGLGLTTSAQMAPMLVAIAAASRFHNPLQASPKGWMITALISKWGIDQLNRNAVSVTIGKDTLQFVRQPNGVFTPPANCTYTLLKTNSAYWLQERHGNLFKFNSSGWLTNITDQYSQRLTLTYNASNWVTEVKDWKNRTLTLNYSGTPSRLTSVVDNSNRTVTFGYSTSFNSQGDLVSVTDPENKTSRFAYDSNHNLTAISNALNQLVATNIYDSRERIATQYTEGDTNKVWNIFWSPWETVIKDPAGGKKHYFYDDKGRMVQKKDALNNSTYTLYDGQNHVALTISPLLEPTSFSYDDKHNLTMTLDPGGFTNRFFYDSQNNLIRSVDARGNTNRFGYNTKFQMTASTNGVGDWVTLFYNPTDGTLNTRTDPAGITTYSYDSYGQLSGITHPGSFGTEGFLNSGLGDVLSRTNARGFVTGFQYNSRRELTNTVAPTNLTFRTAFDAVGNVSSVTDGRGFVASNLWSPTRKLLVTMFPATPQGIPIVTNVYDSRDLLSRTIHPLLATTLFTNDPVGRVASVTDPVKRTTRYGYDPDGRLVAATNAAQEISRQEWNERSHLTKSTDPALRAVMRSYDSFGNQIALTNRNGKKWEFRFDAANRLTNTITPLNRETRLTYDNRGRLSILREPSTQTTTNWYDAKGRLTNRVDGVGATLFRYDGNNNLTNIVELGKTNSWAFDAYDRISSYRDADGNLIQYRYDANGNITNLIYPGGKTVTYLYDSLNRLTNVTDWADRRTTFSYDLASRLTNITRPNGSVREIKYDIAGQMTNIVEKLTNQFPIAFFKMNWNEAARMDWEFAAPKPQPYTPPTRTMTFDDDNRIATFNGINVSHDPDGNMISGPLTNNSLVVHTYDARNRLLSVGGISYAYDPAGNRIGITNGAAASRFVVNPNAALSQVLMRVKNGVTNYYIYGAGLLYEITETATTAKTLTHHYDLRGSTVALSDDSGAVTDRIEYSAYGTITHRAGTNDTPFLFNGRYGVQTDPNGLLYMRARYYNPFICRFINADPSGFSGGLNFYAYADGNPISYLDPFGLDAFDYGTGISLLDKGLDWVAENFANPVGDAVVNGLSQQIQRIGAEILLADYIVDRALHNSGGGVGNANPLPLLLLLGTRGGSVPARAEMIAAERTAVQLEFPFARGASIQTPGVTTAGETFVRVGAAPKYLNYSFDGAGGALPKTYAMPEATFNAIGRNPAALQSLLDLPGSAPVYYRYLQPPPGTLIQRGIVPGGEFGGVGGTPEVLFPKGF
jgi:RHS repeat-associated protein